MQERYRIDDVVKRIQHCLQELGFNAQTKISEHEGLVFARKEIEGDCVRVVTHVSDRMVQPANAGGPDDELRRARAAQIAIKPSLANRVASRSVPAPDQPKEPCD